MKRQEVNYTWMKLRGCTRSILCLLTLLAPCTNDVGQPCLCRDVQSRTRWLGPFVVRLIALWLVVTQSAVCRPQGLSTRASGRNYFLLCWQKKKE
jgi:hypothetical protein